MYLAQQESPSRSHGGRPAAATRPVAGIAEPNGRWFAGSSFDSWVGLARGSAARHCLAGRALLTGPIQPDALSLNSPGAALEVKGYLLLFDTHVGLEAAPSDRHEH
jgi:hypothetical protein